MMITILHGRDIEKTICKSAMWPKSCTARFRKWCRACQTSMIILEMVPKKARGKLPEDKIAESKISTAVNKRKKKKKNST